MKSRIPHAVAALLAAGTVSLATAQTTAPATAAPVFVQEPIASLSKANTPEGDLGRLIAQSLNGEQSLQRSKITVQVDELGNVLLTGVTMTQEQSTRAAELAQGQAGEAKVVNAIQPERIVYRMPAA